MNSHQRRKLRRRHTCRECGHAAYHCPCSGCNGYDEVKKEWCDCGDFTPLSSKHKLSLQSVSRSGS